MDYFHIQVMVKSRIECLVTDSFCKSTEQYRVFINSYSCVTIIHSHIFIVSCMCPVASCYLDSHTQSNGIHSNIQTVAKVIVMYSLTLSDPIYRSVQRVLSLDPSCLYPCVNQLQCLASGHVRLSSQLQQLYSLIFLRVKIFEDFKDFCVILTILITKILVLQKHLLKLISSL